MQDAVKRAISRTLHFDAATMGREAGGVVVRDTREPSPAATSRQEGELAPTMRGHFAFGASARAGAGGDAGRHADARSWRHGHAAAWLRAPSAARHISLGFGSSP